MAGRFQTVKKVPQIAVIANQSANVIKAIGDTITTKKPEDALESLFALARKEASERKGGD